MKKIMALMLMLMMFCQVCVAFEQPNPSRWIPLTDGDEVATWMDTQTVRFEKKFGENFANLWLLTHDKKENLSTRTNMEINMDKREYRFLSFVIYDDNGKSVHSGRGPLSFIGIPPESTGDEIYNILCRMKKLGNSSGNDSRSVASILNK